jgi:plastocyanin
MKTILFSLCTLFCLDVQAQQFAVVEVHVRNFEFSPATFTAVVGDTIRFLWDIGTHTTTSTSVPAGAAMWDSPMDARTETFDYKTSQPGNYSFKCTPHEAFGMVGTFVVNSGLPVKLISLSAQSQKDKVVIQWKTETEVNSDHFVVRRSEDGINFSEIGTLPAFGNSVAEQSYSFVDSSAKSFLKFIYYQLATVDRDGSTEYSKIILYKNEASKESSLIVKLFPNPTPANSHVHLYFNSESNSELQIALTSLDGKVVMKETLLSSPGVNHSHLHMPDLVPGVYFLNLYLDGRREQYRIVIK